MRELGNLENGRNPSIFKASAESSDSSELSISISENFNEDNSIVWMRGYMWKFIASKKSGSPEKEQAFYDCLYVVMQKCKIEAFNLRDFRLFLKQIFENIITRRFSERVFERLNVDGNEALDFSTMRTDNGLLIQLTNTYDEFRKELYLLQAKTRTKVRGSEIKSNIAEARFYQWWFTLGSFGNFAGTFSRLLCRLFHGRSYVVESVGFALPFIYHAVNVRIWFECYLEGIEKSFGEVCAWTLHGSLLLTDFCITITEADVPKSFIILIQTSYIIGWTYWLFEDCDNKITSISFPSLCGGIAEFFWIVSFISEANSEVAIIISLSMLVWVKLVFHAQNAQKLISLYASTKLADEKQTDFFNGIFTFR